MAVSTHGFANSVDAIGIGHIVLDCPRKNRSEFCLSEGIDVRILVGGEQGYVSIAIPESFALKIAVDGPDGILRSHDELPHASLAEGISRMIFEQREHRLNS